MQHTCMYYFQWRVISIQMLTIRLSVSAILKPIQFTIKAICDMHLRGEDCWQGEWRDLNHLLELNAGFFALQQYSFRVCIDLAHLRSENHCQDLLTVLKVVGYRCKEYLRKILLMYDDYDSICMGQLRAYSTWSNKGHQRMVQTRSKTNMAEETRRKCAWAPTGFRPKDYDNDHHQWVSLNVWLTFSLNMGCHCL